jgi:hypothetical protein
MKIKYEPDHAERSMLAGAVILRERMATKLAINMINNSPQVDFMM